MTEQAGAFIDLTQIFNHYAEPSIMHIMFDMDTKEMGISTNGITVKVDDIRRIEDFNSNSNFSPRATACVVTSRGNLYVQESREEIKSRIAIAQKSLG